MKVSVVSIIYKVEPYLKQCLDSIVNQTYKDLEIVLAVGYKGDGSDDACLDICNEYAKNDDRIKIITATPHGPADARNQGMKLVTGDLLAFVDGDDFVELDYVERMVSHITKYDADIVVIGRYYEYKNITLQDDTVKEPLVMDADEALKIVMSPSGFFLHCWDKMYSKKIFDGLYFDTDVVVEDRIVVNRLIGKADRIVYDSTPGYHFRERSDSLSKQSGMIRNNVIANEIFMDYILNNHPKIANECYCYMLKEYITAVQNELVDSDCSKDDLKEYQGKVKKVMDLNKANPCIGKSLRLKSMMAVNMPALLKQFTKWRQKKMADTNERYLQYEYVTKPRRRKEEVTEIDKKLT